MRQYFKAINTQKQEYVCAHCMDGGAQLWEWAVNPYGAIFMLLLRQSTETCDGDYVEPPEDLLRIITMKEHPLAVVLAQWNAVEGHPMKDFKESVVGCWTVGRWAGDPVYMIGDYDESGLYEESKSYRNITRDLVEQWNRFVQLPSHELSYDPCESCG